MIKKINLTLIIILLTVGIIGCKEPAKELTSDLIKMRLNGNIKSIKEIEYTLDSDNKEKQGIYSITSFNDKGNKENISNYDSGNSIYQQTSFTYLKSHSIEKEINNDYEKPPHQERLYNYDNNGKLLNIIINDLKNNTSFTELELRYNDKNQKTIELSFNADGTSDFKKTFTYSIEGKLDEEQWLSSNGILYYTFKTKYDEVGKIASKSRYNDKGKLLESHTFNDKQEAIRIARYDPENTSEISITDSASDFKYEYDDNENWIKRETIEGSKLEFITKRIIEYRP